MKKKPPYRTALLSWAEPTALLDRALIAKGMQQVGWYRGLAFWRDALLDTFLGVGRLFFQDQGFLGFDGNGGELW